MFESNLIQEVDSQLNQINTWADRFDITDISRRKLFAFEIQKLTHPRGFFWCYPINTKEIIARFYSDILYFDGNYIWCLCLSKKQAAKPNLGNLSRQVLLRYRKQILCKGSKRVIAVVATTFTKKVVERVGALLVNIFNQLEDKFCKDKPVKEHIKRRFIYGKQRYFLRLWGMYLKIFNAYLSADLLKIIRSVRCPDYRLYNWLATGITSYRIQLIKAQPLLVPLLIITISSLDRAVYTHGHLANSKILDFLSVKQQSKPAIKIPWSELDKIRRPVKKINGLGYVIFSEVDNFFADFFGVIADKQLPLNKILVFLFQHYSLSELKYIGKMRTYDLGSPLNYLYDMDYDIRLFTAIRLGNKKPKNKIGWQNWSKLYYFVKRWDISNINHFLVGINSLEDEIFSQLYDVSVDLNEILEACQIDYCENPTVNNLLTYIRNCNLLQLKNFVDAYNEKIIWLQKSYDFTMVEEPWKEMLLESPITCPNGITIVELIRPSELEQEAKELNHCVGGYHVETYKGISRIISFKLNGKSLATAEFRIEHHKKNKTQHNLKCVQIRDNRNQTPDSISDEMKAFDWFNKQIRTNKIKVNLMWPNIYESVYGKHNELRDKFNNEIRDWIDAALIKRLVNKNK